ncbi:MAG: EAL domain-containing protein, partial [Sulfurovum sp.]|nr:EAL domain-containing protein [Sulfurovum sp.]
VTDLEDKTTYAMLQSLIHMSQELEVKTVAKWVDNEKQKSTLRNLSIDYIQGFGVSTAIDENTLINQYN